MSPLRLVAGVLGKTSQEKTPEADTPLGNKLVTRRKTLLETQQKSRTTYILFISRNLLQGANGQVLQGSPRRQLQDGEGVPGEEDDSAVGGGRGEEDN